MNTRPGESRPEELWRLIEPLHELFTAGKRLNPDDAEALAEAYFRIGVHSGTVPEKAVEVLGHAHRLDPANPKHPYHLGLLYLRRGQPEQAVAWLTAAAARSPVNHRVRAHLSIALRDLDAVQKDAAGYTGTDRARGEQVAVGVRDGVDAFDPSFGKEAKADAKANTEPGADIEADTDAGTETGTEAESNVGAAQSEPAPAVALIRPGVCRWSGIHDVEAEARLRGRTTERTRDTLAAELETVVELAARRPGGAAAFTVLAVQWMVSGYPVATIRRLADRLPSGDGPAVRLLEVVCELFETDLADLPDRLRDCLVAQSVPDALVALVHRQRLLWRPLRFPDLGAHAAARESAEGEPDRHVKALEAARRELSADRPAPMADRPTDIAAAQSAPVDPDARLAAFEMAATHLTGLRSELSSQIKGLSNLKIESAPDYARIAGDRQLLQDQVDGLEQARTAWLEDLQQSKGSEPVGLVMDFGEFQRRLENCEGAFQQSFRSLLTQLKRSVDKNLGAARPAYDGVEPVPSPQAQELAARCAAVERPQSPTVPEDSSAEPGPAAPNRSNAPTPPQEPLPPAPTREPVAEALAAAEQALDANFAAAWQSLESYRSAPQHRDALVLLRGYITGRQAEAEFRLGRSTSARRRWTAQLADDPLHPGVLHNLAVAHTSAGDRVEAAEAWGRYVEAIYLRDLLNGELRQGGSARASLHRILAASFGTAPLCLEPTSSEDGAEQARQIPLLLSSRAKVALVTSHLRLDEINHTTSHRSPVLLLGIDRADGDGVPAARERRAEALRKAMPFLPARARGAFEKECLRLFDEACTEASEAKGRVRRPGDEAEESAHLEWVRRRIRWKRRLREGIEAGDADWPLTDYSGAVVANLVLVDDLALDPTDPLVRDYVQQLAPGKDPAEIIGYYNSISGSAAQFALQQILTAAGDAAESEAEAHLFAERFRRIGRSWGRNAVPKRWLEILDDPEGLYGESPAAALKIVSETDGPPKGAERQVVEAAVPVLQPWLERLPGATGPARALARLLGALEQHDDALKVLTRAGAEAFSDLGREKVLRARVLLDIVRGNYRSAVDTLWSLLDSRPDDDQLRGLLTSAFDRWIKSGKAVPTPEAITAAFARWTDEDTVRNRRVLALNAALAQFDRGAGKAASFESLVRTLTEMVAADPDHLMAHYHLCEALLGLAGERREQMQSLFGKARESKGAELTTTLRECQRRTRALMPRLFGMEEYEKQCTNLTEIFQKVDAALR